jgi:hypothetical protein
MKPESIEATRWTNNTLCLLKDGGVWSIPLRGMCVRMIDNTKRIVRSTEGLAPDNSVKVAIRNAGWTIQGETK